MKIEVPEEICDTDYVLFDVVENKLIEDYDVIYAAESVIDLFNEGFHLEPNEKFVKMIHLPQNLLEKFFSSILANR